VDSGTRPQESGMEDANAHCAPDFSHLSKFQGSNCLYCTEDTAQNTLKHAISMKKIFWEGG